MAPTIRSINMSSKLPLSTTVVVIGGGMVGLCAALTLAERNIPVVVLEKGTLAGEQSSRNLGWVRKTNRSADDIPLALAADRLWAGMAERTGFDVGYRQTGIMFTAPDSQYMTNYERWLASVEHLSLGSRLLSKEEINRMVPGGQGQWKGAVYTSSDGRAEPTLAASAVAQAAMAKGAIIIEHCAVRSLSRSAGNVTGVVTEKGEILCQQVILAGGSWSRRFLGNSGVSLPTLPLVASVIRTKPMKGPTEIAVGGPNFSFRKHIDGGYIIMQRGALEAPLTLDHLSLGLQYLPQLKASRGSLRIKLNKFSLADLTLPRRWLNTDISPFERVRTYDPTISHSLNQDAMSNLRRAWPIFNRAEIEQSWAGIIDVTPDSTPIIGPIENISGLILASGFSGHGFGTSPAAGQLAADLACGMAPLVDPKPYHFNRF